MRKLMIAMSLFAMPAMADTAEEFAADAVGTWSSADQSASPDYAYVVSQTAQIMAEREDGVWLYQQNWILGETADEVAEGASIESTAPYFQVVIQVRDLGDGALHSTTYRIPDEQARQSAVSVRPNAAETFDPTWIGEVACMGHMQRVGDGFWQGGASCPNGYKGGVKVESRSVRAPDMYVNWDRGFDAEGTHIWGPAGGGYVFKREGDKE